MRITCTSTPEGNVYRFYQSSSDLGRALKPVVPFLLAIDAEVIVGNEAGDPKLLIRVGPISGDAEVELLELTQRFITTHCPPVAA